jgi:hypothetical protein
MKKHLNLATNSLSLHVSGHLIISVIFGALALIPARAAHKNVWIELPVDTRASAVNYVLCTDTEVEFVASHDHPPGGSWSWSGATMTSNPTNTPSTASRTFTTPGGPYPVSATYNGETSYAANVYLWKLLRVEFKRSDEPDDFYHVDGGGDVALGETYNYRLIMEGNISPIRWEIWADLNNDFTMLRSGSGTTFTHSMTNLGRHNVAFFADINGDQHCRIVHDGANAINVVVQNVTVAAHRHLGFSDQDADSKLASATSALRKRDRLDDLRVAVELRRSGSVTTFGQADPVHDPTAFINNEEQLNKVFAVPGHFKVVDYIDWPTEQTVGVVAERGVWNVVITRNAPGYVWAHEFGHCKDMPNIYDPPTHRIMYYRWTGQILNTVGEYERFKFK